VRGRARGLVPNDGSGTSSNTLIIVTSETHCAGICRLLRLARSPSVALAASIGLAISFIGAGTLAATVARAAEVSGMAYPGSMETVMDQFAVGTERLWLSAERM